LSTREDVRFESAIVGPPGSLAAMTTPDAEPGYPALYPDGFEWRNEVPARIALRITTYSPGKRAGDVACPLLVLVAADDVVTPPGPARAAARRAPKGELVEYQGVGHFDVYLGEPFERAVADQLEFLARVLPS
jgi:pimeloyl-ACP methyl ester carboxylesterase